MLLNHKELSLLKYVRINMQSEDENGLKNLRNGVLTLVNVAKVHNPELRPWVREITCIVVEVINFHKDKDTHIELETEIIESAITTLTFLLRGYSSEIVEFMEKGTLETFIEECLNFDLEGMMNYVCEEMEAEDEYEMEDEYFNEDTVCWKVRAAILRYITTLMHKDKVFKDNKAKQ